MLGHFDYDKISISPDHVRLLMFDNTKLYLYNKNDELIKTFPIPVIQRIFWRLDSLGAPMSHLPYQRLQTNLAMLIAKTPAGTRLPSEPELAKQLGVSRATLRETMRMFESQGMIRRRQGAGTFVIGQAPAVESGLEVLESLDSLAQRTGMKISVSSVQIAHIPADDVSAALLGIPAKRLLIQISRIIRVDAHPVAYLIDTLAEDFLRSDELTNNFNGSVLDFLMRRGDPLTVSRDDILAIGASADIAKTLEVDAGTPLLQICAKLYTSADKVVDCSISYFVPGYFDFHVIRRMRTA